jgi:hypothetical protein
MKAELDSQDRDGTGWGRRINGVSLQWKDMSRQVRCCQGKIPYGDQIHDREGVLTGSLYGRLIDVWSRRATRMRLRHLRTTALVGHLQTARLFLCVQFVERNGASHHRRGKH